MGKTNNITKSLFTVPTIKNLNPQKNQIEDKETSNSYKIILGGSSKKLFCVAKSQIIRVVSRSIIRNQFHVPFLPYTSGTEENLIRNSIRRIPPVHPVQFLSS